MYSMYSMLIPCPHRLLHIKYQYKTSFPKTKMMFPWARQISSVMPITVMILPFVWPFLGHVAYLYYPLPRSSVTFLHSRTVLGVNLPPLNIMGILTQLTKQLLKAIFRDLPGQPLSERCFPLGHEMMIASSGFHPLIRASFLLTGSHQTGELHWD